MITEPTLPLYKQTLIAGRLVYAMKTKFALRVLLVEPCNDFRYVFGTLLRLMGHTVEAVRTPAEALDTIRKYPADVVLVELGFGDVETLDLTVQIRKLQLDVTAVAICSYITSDSKAIVAGAGFDFVLAKPITYKDIGAVFDAIIDSKGHRPDLIH